MKKLGLCCLALAGVMSFSGCSCFKNGEYTFHSVEVKDGDETKTYTCEKDEKRDTAGNLACVAVVALPKKVVLDGDKLTIEIEVFGESKSQEYEAKIEDKKLLIKDSNSDNWAEFAEFKGGKLIFGEEGYTVIYKK